MESPLSRTDLLRETKGRGGKGVTVIKGAPLEGDALSALGKQ